MKTSIRGLWHRPWRRVKVQLLLNEVFEYQRAGRQEHQVERDQQAEPGASLAAAPGNGQT